MRNIDISFIADFPTERMPKMPLSGVSTRLVGAREVPSWGCGCPAAAQEVERGAEAIEKTAEKREVAVAAEEPSRQDQERKACAAASPAALRR